MPSAGGDGILGKLRPAEGQRRIPERKPYAFPSYPPRSVFGKDDARLLGCRLVGQPRPRQALKGFGGHKIGYAGAARRDFWPPERDQPLVNGRAGIG